MPMLRHPKYNLGDERLLERFRWIQFDRDNFAFGFRYIVRNLEKLIVQFRTHGEKVSDPNLSVYLAKKLKPKLEEFVDIGRLVCYRDLEQAVQIKELKLVEYDENGNELNGADYPGPWYRMLPEEMNKFGPRKTKLRNNY